MCAKRNQRSTISSTMPLGASRPLQRPRRVCNETMKHLVGHFFDGSRLNHLASLYAVAKVTGRLVCLEPGAHDVAEGAMRGQTMPRIKAELLINPYSAGIRIRVLSLHRDPCDG